MAARQYSRVEEAYRKAIARLTKSHIPFLVGGAYAMWEYGDIVRDTKDLDIFCTPHDYPLILSILKQEKFSISITDPSWLAKALKKKIQIDIIFGAGNRLHAVEESWYKRSQTVEVLGFKVHLLPVEEMILLKLFVRERDRYDGADINHIIRKYWDRINWHDLLARLDLHWELLFSALLEFRFVYPSERDKIPLWLLKEMITRVRQQFSMPEPKERVCRGVFLAHTQYRVDLAEWGYRI